MNPTNQMMRNIEIFFNAPITSRIDAKPNLRKYIS